MATHTQRSNRQQRRRPPPQPPQRPKTLKRKRDVEDLETLTHRVAELDAHPSTPPTEFSQLPLSESTQAGLSASHFKKLTPIQSRAIPSALKGNDILGAAKTGSGKTLAFLIPVLENLYRARWTQHDGLGALILSPTRELALQIFEVLRKVGRKHTFSAGLVIGGKSLQDEKERLGKMNILVATPGRMMQHLDQTSELEVGGLRMLVLDEADRVLDQGFAREVDAILEHLPKGEGRQTLLFSATQSKRVSDLARLSLSEPEFVGVHGHGETQGEGKGEGDEGESATPAKLQQNYIVTPLPEKLDTLWGFVRANVKKKILVFLSSGKQVRFVYEAFRHLQPGLTVLHLHGRQKQSVRLDITKRFSNARYACLFSTDVAARGLDFPSVDWVVQVDAPEDTDTYIHRVGRTARSEHEGRAVLFLDPSEESGMIGALEKKRVTVEKISVRQSKMQNSIKAQLQNMCFKDSELKYLGQKAFVSYVRSIVIQKDKQVFDVKKLDLEGYASSLGLPGAPRVKFLKNDGNEGASAKRKNMPRQLLKLQEEMEAGGSGEDEGDGQESGRKAKKEKEGVRTRYDRMFERQNQDVLANHYTKLIQEEEDDDNTHTRNGNEPNDDDNAFLSVKRRFEAGDEGLNQQDSDSNDDDGSDASSANPSSNGPNRNSSSTTKPNGNSPSNKPKTLQLGTNPEDILTIDSNRRAKLLSSKKALLKFKGRGEHLHFSSDSERDDHHDVPYKKEYYEPESAFAADRAEAEEKRKKFVEEGIQEVKERDRVDKEVARGKRREKIERRKARERGEVGGVEGAEDGEEDVQVQLAPGGVEIVPDWSDGDFEDYDNDNVNDDDNQHGADVGNLDKKPKEKRKKKWFEDASSGDEVDDRSKKRKKSGKNKVKAATEPQTLEDLEALASGLLAR